LLGQALDSLDGRSDEFLGVEIATREPAQITTNITPLDFNGAEFGNEGGPLWLFVPVEDDGRDACHNTTRARLTGEGRSGSLWMWVGLNLQSLERPKCGADGVHFPGVHLLLTVGELQFESKVTQHVEAFIELVADGEAQVDAFFNSAFGTVGRRSFGGGIVDHGFGDEWWLRSRRHWGRPARCCCCGNGRRW